MPARTALLLWLTICVVLGMLFGWPIIACSIGLAVGPAYLSMRSRNFLIAIPFAVGGALVGAIAFTAHGIISAVFISLLTGFVVGHGVLMAAMWFHHRREIGGRSA